VRACVRACLFVCLFVVVSVLVRVYVGFCVFIRICLHDKTRLHVVSADCCKFQLGCSTYALHIAGIRA